MSFFLTIILIVALTLLVVAISIFLSKSLVKSINKNDEIFKKELEEKNSPNPLIRENHNLKLRVKNYQMILLFSAIAISYSKHNIENLGYYVFIAMASALLLEPILHKWFTTDKNQTVTAKKPLP